MASNTSKPTFMICRFISDDDGEIQVIHDTCRMKVIYPLEQKQQEIQVFVGQGLFPPFLSRVMEYSCINIRILSSDQDNNGSIVCPEYVGARVIPGLRSENEVNLMLGHCSEATRRFEMDMFHHGARYLQTWEQDKVFGIINQQPPLLLLLGLGYPSHTSNPRWTQAQALMMKYLQRQTIGQGRLQCPKTAMDEFPHDTADLEFLVQHCDIQEIGYNDLALSLEWKINALFYEIVVQKCLYQSEMPSPYFRYSYIMYFDQKQEQHNIPSWFPFPSCRIVCNAQNVLVIDAMKIILEATQPVFFYGCTESRRPDAGFTVCLADWPRPMRWLCGEFDSR
jgi:hypothetical protein